MTQKDVFTDEQVRSFNEFQKSGSMHPFTCGNGCGNLIASNEGLYCPKCDYRQYWAHSFMLNWDWKRISPFQG